MALQASFTGQSFFVGKNTPYGLIKGYVQKGRLVSAFCISRVARTIWLEEEI